MFSKLFILATTTISLLYGTSAQLVPNCDRTYTVQPLDTCFSISAAQNVSSFQLDFVNPGIDANCDDLFPGEILCLGVTGEDCQTTDVVQEGDVCPTIAAAANISESTLLANNPNINSDCSNIQVGEVLCTANVVFHYT